MFIAGDGLPLGEDGPPVFFPLVRGEPIETNPVRPGVAPHGTIKILERFVVPAGEPRIVLGVDMADDTEKVTGVSSSRRRARCSRVRSLRNRGRSRRANHRSGRPQSANRRANGSGASVGGRASPHFPRPCRQVELDSWVCEQRALFLTLGSRKRAVSRLEHGENLLHVVDGAGPDAAAGVLKCSPEPRRVRQVGIGGKIGT